MEIHICCKVLMQERMEPPIHTEYLRSGGATTLIFIVDGARAVSSFVMRLADSREHRGATGERHVCVEVGSRSAPGCRRAQAHSVEASRRARRLMSVPPSRTVPARPARQLTTAPGGRRARPQAPWSLVQSLFRGPFWRFRLIFFFVGWPKLVMTPMTRVASIQMPT